MRKRLTLILTLTLTAAMIGAALTYAGGGRGLRADLTEDQRAGIRDLVTGMRENDATREEIRTAMGAKLAEFGVELPEKSAERPRRGRRGFRGLCADLTEEQRTTIRQTVQEMREDGVSREEIRAAARELLEGYGVELPESPGTEASSKATSAGTSIAQNTPNPFNPTTTIAYELSEPGDVTLRVYSITGQEVATLVSSYQQPGHYEAAWDGSGFANGVYVYRLQAGKFTDTKRMLLLK